MSRTSLGTAGLSAIVVTLVLTTIGAPVTHAAGAARAPGEQRRWALDFRVRLEQPGGERPVEIRLNGDWVSTISAVRPGELDAALELVNARLKGEGIRSASAEANEQLERRIWHAPFGPPTGTMVHCWQFISSRT
jgi:hypothetical protein